jgi:transcriptional regulator of acetoin/glycerol metabolism
LGDLPALLGHLVASVGAPQLTIPECVIERLAQHSWPGNVRELRNVVSHARALRPDAAIFELPDLLGTEELEDAPRLEADLGGNYREARAEALGSFEKRYVASLLTRHGWNVSGAAREAGVDRNYLHRLIRRHDIQRP